MKRCSLFLIALLFLFSGCLKKNEDKNSSVSKNSVKIGFIYVGSVKDMGYNQAQDSGRVALGKAGFKTMYVENVPENDKAVLVMEALIKQGCNIIYCTSYGYKPYVLETARRFPEVKFGHCSGDERLSNVSTYFGRIYEARYLTGLVAGLRTSTNRIGYVAAFPVPECIRGINAFALGVKAVNPDAIVEVKFTHSWNDSEIEEKKAEELLKSGCDVMTQHQNSTIIQKKAQEKGAYCIGYNSSMIEAAPKSYLTAAVFNWEVFVLDDVNSYIEGNWKSRFYWEGLDSGMVDIDSLTKLCVPGTARIVEEAKNKIINKSLSIFKGPIYDNSGNLKIGDGVEMTSSEIWNMDWFVEGIVCKDL